MTMVVLRHTVENFEHWKQHFDAGESMRSQAGARVISLAREVTNPNTVVVITEWESAEKAKAFLSNPALREGMAKAGIVGPPESFVLEIAK